MRYHRQIQYNALERINYFLYDKISIVRNQCIWTHLLILFIFHIKRNRNTSLKISTTIDDLSRLLLKLRARYCRQVHLLFVIRYMSHFNNEDLKFPRVCGRHLPGSVFLWKARLNWNVYRIRLIFLTASMGEPNV